jgi:hypothetical protein
LYRDARALLLVVVGLVLVALLFVGDAVLKPVTVTSQVTVKPRYCDWSSWTVVQVSDADGIDVHRECAESQAVRE